MCGIIGIIGKKEVANRLVDGLKRLEYRGYDSAGIATVSGDKILRCRAEGKINKLEKELLKKKIAGNIGIGHTRWATHGVPNTKNAHPHATKKVAVVHNGIIENFGVLRKELEKKGYKFSSDTDTEVIPQLITYFLDNGKGPKQAVKETVKKLEGAYAIGVVFAEHGGLMAIARQGSPLAIGYGKDEIYMGSDAIALAPLSSQISYLEDGDVAFLDSSGAEIFDAKEKKVKRKVVSTSASSKNIGKENYDHFMLKEIYEQPSVIGDVLSAYYNPVAGVINMPKIPKTKRINIVACGTSYYAGMVAKYWFEKIAGVPVDIDVASEFRYRNAILEKGGVSIFISQSGETADTLAALRYAKKQKQKIIAVVNVPESTMAREADIVLPTYSGPEIGVASTKAFTTQLITMACLIISIALQAKKITKKQVKDMAHSLSEAPSRIAEVLNHDESIKKLAKNLAKAKDILYIGRGVSYGIALEGALKLKEISYIHAEATAAGELKHGPIALVDKDVPIIAIAPSDDLFDKTASNIREVAARGGKVVLLSDKKGISKLKDVTYASINLPDAADFVSPVLNTIPIQLIAYHVAVIKGTDVDQPRNLAKSVTVE